MSTLGSILDLKTLTGLLGSGTGLSGLTDGVIGSNLLGSDTLGLDLLGTDLLGPGGLGGLGGVTQIIELDGLLSDAGLLNLTGLLDNGVLSLGGVLGDVLKLLNLGGKRDTPDPIDPNEEVDPNAFKHQLIGTDKRDVFTILTESTYVDGRGEIDIANFARSAEGMGFAVGTNGVLVADETAMFFLRDVERISFLEGTLLLDTGAGENAGMAYRIYQAAFDRKPDSAGLKYWLNELDSGKASFTQIANHFIHSREFISTFGTNDTVSNARFLELMYTHTLGRAFDPAGLTYWLGRLDADAMSRADVLALFAESPENQQRVAEQIDNGIWMV